MRLTPFCSVAAIQLRRGVGVCATAIFLGACSAGSTDEDARREYRYGECRFTEADVQASRQNRNAGRSFCSLLLEPTGIFLRSARNGEHPDPGSIITRSQDGRFFSNSATESGALLEWDVRGNFVRKIGRAGRGPGEFIGMGITAFPIIGDTLVVYSSRTWTIFDRARNVLGSIDGRLPLLLSRPGFTLAPGGLVVVGDRLFGNTLSVVTLSGELIAGWDKAVDDPSGRRNERRAVTMADSAHFWAGPVPNTSPRLEKWSLRGELTEALPLSDICCASEIRHGTGSSVRHVVTGLAQSDSGLIYVTQVFTPVNAVGEVVGEPELVAKVVLDVIDPRSRLMVARSGPLIGKEVYFGHPIPFPGTNLAARRVESEEGFIDWEVVRMTIRPVSR